MKPSFCRRPTTIPHRIFCFWAKEQMDAFEKSFRDVNALNSTVGINVSFAKLSVASSSSSVVPSDWLICPSKIWPSSWNKLNQNLNFYKLWPLNRGYRLSIKSSKSLGNKGFFAVCSPYPFIRFHYCLCFPRDLIREKSREEKTRNTI